MKKISVIVPVYNAETTLNKCVDSIIAQNYKNLEIILLDDGSSDNSLNLCNEYKEKDSRIVVYHKENEGLVAARKNGLEIATGEYVSFVDSDDYIDADLYELLINEAQKNNSDIVMSGIKFDYEDRQTVAYNKICEGYYDKDGIRKDIIPNMLMKNGFYQFGIIPGVVTKIFKKSLIINALSNVYNEVTMGEDVAITSFAVMQAESISVINKAAYHYVQTETSMIRGYNPNRFNDICKMYECISRIKEDTYAKQVGGYFTCVLYGVLAQCIRNSDLTKAEIYQKVKEMLNDEHTVAALSSADVSGWKLEDKIKYLFIKYKMVKLITKLLKR